MQCTVHFIITLFNVGNVLLCIICQLNFTVFMYVTQISVIYSVWYYLGRCWNILPMDMVDRYRGYGATTPCAPRP
jgi:hypothetical protein